MHTDSNHAVSFEKYGFCVIPGCGCKDRKPFSYNRIARHLKPIRLTKKDIERRWREMKKRKKAREKLLQELKGRKK